MQANLKNVFIVIPAHNEEGRIHLVLEEVIALGFENIVVVNDASTDNTSSIAGSYEHVRVLNHLINLGPGGATQTGIEFSLLNNAEYIATIDADYQHDPSDLVKLTEKIQSENLDIVVGSRFLQSNEIPKIRIFYNRIANFINYLLTGKVMSDSQSGLKIIRSDLAKKLALETNGFEFCIEIIKNAQALNAKILEIPIAVRYTKETMQKGQSLSTGVSMLSRIFSPFN